jgi:hypothetical protein
MAPKSSALPITAAGNAFGGSLLLGSVLGGCLKTQRTAFSALNKTPSLDETVLKGDSCVDIGEDRRFYEQTIQALQELADDGSPQAQYELAELYQHHHEYFNGVSQEECLSRAVDLYTVAVLLKVEGSFGVLKAIAKAPQSTQYKKANHALGIFYEEDFRNHENDDDLTEAVSCYHKAAGQGYEPSQEAIFRMIEEDDLYELIEEDYRLAAEYKALQGKTEELVPLYLLGCKKFVENEEDGTNESLVLLKGLAEGKTGSEAMQQQAQEALQDYKIWLERREEAIDLYTRAKSSDSLLSAIELFYQSAQLGLEIAEDKLYKLASRHSDEKVSEYAYLRLGNLKETENLSVALEYYLDGSKQWVNGSTNRGLSFDPYLRNNPNFSRLCELRHIPKARYLIASFNEWVFWNEKIGLTPELKQYFSRMAIAGYLSVSGDKDSDPKLQERAHKGLQRLTNAGIEGIMKEIFPERG